MYEFQELSKENKVLAVKNTYEHLVDCIASKLILVDENSYLAKKLDLAFKVSETKKLSTKDAIKHYAGNELRNLAMVAAKEALYDETGSPIYEV